MNIPRVVLLACCVLAGCDRLVTSSDLPAAARRYPMLIFSASEGDTVELRASAGGPPLLATRGRHDLLAFVCPPAISGFDARTLSRQPEEGYAEVRPAVAWRWQPEAAEWLPTGRPRPVWSPRLDAERRAIDGRPLPPVRELLGTVCDGAVYYDRADAEPTVRVRASEPGAVPWRSEVDARAVSEGSRRLLLTAGGLFEIVGEQAELIDLADSAAGGNGAVVQSPDGSEVFVLRWGAETMTLSRLVWRDEGWQRWAAENTPLVSGSLLRGGLLWLGPGRALGGAKGATPRLFEAGTSTTTHPYVDAVELITFPGSLGSAMVFDGRVEFSPPRGEVVACPTLTSVRKAVALGEGILILGDDGRLFYARRRGCGELPGALLQQLWPLGDGVGLQAEGSSEMSEVVRLVPARDLAP